MNEGLDAALVLTDEGGKPNKQYRTSPYTVRQYCALPYAQRAAVDAACDARAGIERIDYHDDTSVVAYTVGRATQKVKGAQQAPLTPTTSQSLPAMTTAHVHPAPSPALHTLNTPEVAHADFAFTPAGLPEGAPLAALTDAVDLAGALPAAAPVAHESTVYETTNYDLFHLLPENRAVYAGHVRKLVAQIRENNLLRIKPLDVTADLGVIDGQHRLAAARELGVPVYYKISQELSEEAIKTLNVGQKNWQATDYLHYWTVKRKPAYVAFTDFRARHPRISFSNAKIMLSGGTGGLGAELFRQGRWDGADDVDMAIAEQVATLVERIATETPFKQPTHTGFVGALYHCVLKVKDFDPAEMMRTILAQPLSLLPCASHKQWLEMLGRIYNYRKNEDNRIRFE